MSPSLRRARMVVVPPPSRSALDFLDAPQRLGRFLDGRLIRLLTAPARTGMSAMRVLNAGFAMMTGALTKLLGAQGLKDAQTFVTALDTMFGGFRERAETTYRLLQTPGTAFLVVAAPEPDALREASYFVERLDAERMPLAGLILNRVHVSPAARLSAARSLAAAEALDVHDQPDGPDGSGPRYGLAAAVLRMHAAPLKQLAPRGHFGPAAQERTPLPLGHPTPDTELDSVVERIRKALRANRAAPADQLGAILRRALDEQLVRVSSLACGACGPVSDPHVPTPLDRRARAPRRSSRWVAIPGYRVRPRTPGYLFLLHHLPQSRPPSHNP